MYNYNFLCKQIDNCRYLGHEDGEGKCKHRHKEQASIAKRMIGPYSYQAHIHSGNYVTTTLPNVSSLSHLQE